MDAVTVKVYAVPLVSEETVIGDPPVPVLPPGEDVAVNVVAPVPAAPAVYGTDADAFPAEAVPIVGAPGRLPAVTELDEADVAVPNDVVAVTVNVYAVPAVSPETRIGLAPLPEPPAGLEVIV